MPSAIKSYFAKIIAAGSSKAHWAEVLKRSIITFMAAFFGQLGLAQANITSSATAKIIVISAGTFAANVVIRSIWLPELKKLQLQIVPIVIHEPEPPTS